MNKGEKNRGPIEPIVVPGLFNLIKDKRKDLASEELLKLVDLARNGGELGIFYIGNIYNDTIYINREMEKVRTVIHFDDKTKNVYGVFLSEVNSNNVLCVMKGDLSIPVQHGSHAEFVFLRRDVGKISIDYSENGGVEVENSNIEQAKEFGLCIGDDTKWHNAEKANALVKEVLEKFRG